MPIQYVLIVAIALIIVRLLFKFKNKEINRAEFLLWLVIWLTALAVISYPKFTSYLAIKLGVTRGVDLIVYVAIVVAFYLLFKLFARLNKIDKDITKIVRHISLKDERNHK